MLYQIFLLLLLGRKSSSRGTLIPVITKSGEVITVQQGKHIDWKSVVECEDVLIIPHMQCIIYVSSSSTYARRYDGRFLWRHSNVGSGPTASLCAGKSHLFKFSHGPTNHGAFSNWRSIFSTSFIEVLDLRTGKELWSDVSRNMGMPIWANENLFLTVGTDTTPLVHFIYPGPTHPLMASQVKRLRTFLEVRRVNYGSLVRRIRIPGWPHNVQIRRINSKYIEVKSPSYQIPITPQEVKPVKRPFTAKVMLEEAKTEKLFHSIPYHFVE